MDPLNKNYSCKTISAPKIEEGHLLFKKIKKLLARLYKTISLIFADVHPSDPKMHKNVFTQISAKVTVLEARIAIFEEELKKEKEDLENRRNR